MRQAPKTEEGIKAQKRMQLMENVTSIVALTMQISGIFLIAVTLLRGTFPNAWDLMVKSDDPNVLTMLVGALAVLLAADVVRLRWRIKKLEMVTWILVNHADETDEELGRDP